MQRALGVLVALFLLGVIAFSVLYAVVDVPSPNQLVTAQASIVYWSDGKSELGRFSEAGANRVAIALKKVPLTTQHAVLAAEDRSFTSNAGVSPRGIARALWVKVRGGSTQGGSTITQQYVKNYFLTSDRTYRRKVREFVISLKVEQQESKSTILENYLNTIYFGRGAYGIETASQAYFAHPASQLTLGEGAVLASVIRSPGLYDPVGERARARQRVDYVLGGMVSEGWLSPAERAKARFPKIAPRKRSNANGGTTGYLLKSVQDELRSKVGLSEEEIDQGGLRVVSTFDRGAQKAAVAAIDDELPSQGDKGVRAGLAAVKPGDGAVVAMYGGSDQVKHPLNAATQSVLQAGSTFKPFALAAALEDGVSLRSTFSGQNGITFPGVSTPIRNFGQASYGRIDLLRATANSVNTVYVALNVEVGPQKTVEAAVAAGLPRTTAGLEPNISNVLGTASPRVLDMADAYATFAAKGMHAPPYTVRSVRSTTSKLRYKAPAKADRAFSSDSMADLTYALQGVTRSGSGAYAGANLSRPVAGKTGTSSSNKSAWFTGFTPQLAAAVGIYREKKGAPASLRGLGGLGEVTGGSFPVRIWTAFMRGALEGEPAKDFPDPVFGGTASGLPPVQPRASSSTTSSTTTTTTTTSPTTSTPTTSTPTSSTPTTSTPPTPAAPSATPSPTSATSTRTRTPTATRTIATPSATATGDG